MNILIFDTETGGVNCYANDILQLSYQIIDSRSFNVIKEVNHFFPWPEDKSRVQWGAIQVNGMTEEYLATKELSDRHDALNEFIDDLLDCEVCVAHNGDFDKNFINATAQREGIYRFNWPMMIDTMKTTTELSSALTAQTITYRNSLGRKTGTATTDSRGVTTYRDELGRKTGTSETNSRGVTTYRDNLGRKGWNGRNKGKWNNIS